MSRETDTFPELSGNFVPLPEKLLDILLSGALSRQELLVTLYLGRVTYAFGRDRTFISLEAVAGGTSLTSKDAEAALGHAMQRGTVLQFRTEGPGRFYLLNTEENRRVATVVEENTPAPSAPEPTPQPRPTPVPTPTAPQPVAASPQQPAAGTSRPAPAVHAAPAYHGVTRRVMEKIVNLIGRDLTRDEMERLADLGAPEENLLKAIDNLAAKNVAVYSSDQVIYEYESLASIEKRKADETRKREQAEQVKERVRSCKRCNGLGYIFIGVNTIKECACKKGG
ncbi:MAG: hypothetical protein HY815_24525 [Candidatus Riflebacteria bacterium]|nr:hypothetical protein [Candidatus Riflebacteria bacterium]